MLVLLGVQRQPETYDCRRKNISKKPKGRLYIFEHNPKNPFTRHLVNTCIFDENAVLLKSKYLKSQLEDLEFKIQYLHYILFFPRNRIFSMLHNLEKYLRKIPYGAQYFTVAIK